MNQYGFWGPPEGIDTHDYILMIEGDTPAAAPKKLLGHSLDNPNIDQSDALTITRVKFVSGKYKTVTITKRAPEERGRQYTIGFPNGALDTPAMAAALRPGCRKQVFSKYLCPADAQFNHADIMKDVLFDPLQPAGALITIQDINPVDFTSVIRVSEQVRQFSLVWSPVFTDVTVAMEYHAIGFLVSDCAGCDDIPGESFIFGGGDSTAVASNRRTTDRFGTAPATITDGSTAGNLMTALFVEGNLVIAGYSDDPLVSAGLVGELRVSRDAGLTYAAASGITTVGPIFGIARLGDVIFAVGGTGAGAPKLYQSTDDAKSWSTVTHTLIAGTAAFTSIAADNEQGVAYIVGESGKLYSVKISGTSVQMTDLSTNLPGAPGTLNAVAVFGPDYLAVGGAAGYYAESYDGGLTFTQISVAGSTAITSIAGDRYRSMVGAGINLYQRDVLSDMEYQQVVLDGGAVLTGTVKAIAMRTGTLDDFNMFVAVTTDAEVVMGKDPRPTS